MGFSSYDTEVLSHPSRGGAMSQAVPWWMENVMENAMENALFIDFIDDV